MEEIKMQQLVSVIISTYNYAKYLPEAINSVLNQTYQDFEIVIVDDGSTDNTREIIEGYLKDYPDKIRYFFQTNKGCEPARNRGIIESAGNYIAILDADDIWLPDKLRIQMDFFEKNPDIGLVHTNYILSTGERQIANFNFAVKPRHFSGYVFPYLLRECFIRGSTATIKKECLNEVGLFDETLTDDYELWLRFSKKYKFGYIDKQLVICLEHPRQVRRLNFNRTYQIVWRSIEKTLEIFPEIKNDPQVRISLSYRKAKIHFELGYHLFCKGELKESRREFNLSLKYKFTSLTFIYYLLTFLNPSLLSLCKKPKRRLERFLFRTTSLIRYAEKNQNRLH